MHRLGRDLGHFHSLILGLLKETGHADANDINIYKANIQLRPVQYVSCTIAGSPAFHPHTL